MSLDRLVGEELEWSQPKMLRRFFTLAHGEDEVAWLRFESSSRAMGACDDGVWTFKRTGFLPPRVTVRDGGSEVDIAVFTPTWTGPGTVVFASGARYQFRPSNFWRTEWQFETEDGRALMKLSGRTHIFKQGAIATLLPDAPSVPGTPVLLLLMWYVTVMMNEENASAAAVVACS